MEMVEKISKVIAIGIVMMLKILVYPLFYITKTFRVFFLIIEKWSFSVLESFDLKNGNKAEEDDALGMNFNPNTYYKE